MIITCDNCSSKKGRKKKNCQIHSFVMKNTISTAKYKAKTNINFCPILNKSTNLYQNIFPHFNADGKSHLPSFTLQTDDSYFQNYEQRYVKDHQKKISQYSTDKSQIWQPKPNRKNKYCAVCKDNYEEYRDHIKCENHRTHITKNRFNTFINLMCLQIQKQQNRQNSLEQFERILKHRKIHIQLNQTTDQSRITS